MDNNFSFCNSLFRSLQPELAHANEINRDILRSNTLIWKKRFDRKNMAAVSSGR